MINEASQSNLGWCILCTVGNVERARLGTLCEGLYPQAQSVYGLVPPRDQLSQLSWLSVIPIVGVKRNVGVDFCPKQRIVDGEGPPQVTDVTNGNHGMRLATVLVWDRGDGGEYIRKDIGWNASGGSEEILMLADDVRVGLQTSLQFIDLGFDETSSVPLLVDYTVDCIDFGRCGDVVCVQALGEGRLVLHLVFVSMAKARPCRL